MPSPGVPRWPPRAYLQPRTGDPMETWNPTYACQKYDMTTPPAPHRRNGSFDEVDVSEIVGLELVPNEGACPGRCSELFDSADHG